MYVCMYSIYYVIGRIQEAKKHFEMAISLNSNYFKAIYNLGK
jgi:tetratricopeptide (TPR) repeat protein